MNLKTVAICLAVGLLASCRTRVEFHELQRLDGPTTVAGVKIWPKMRHSPRNKTQTNWGRPWRVGLVSEGDETVSKLTITSAICDLEGNDDDVVLVSPDKPVEEAFTQISKSESILTLYFQDKLDVDLPANSRVLLKLRGAVWRGAHREEFDIEARFRSVVKVSSTVFPPLVD
jgi:hypothetical protein